MGYWLCDFIVDPFWAQFSRIKLAYKLCRIHLSRFENTCIYIVTDHVQREVLGNINTNNQSQQEFNPPNNH